MASLDPKASGARVSKEFDNQTRERSRWKKRWYQEADVTTKS